MNLSKKLNILFVLIIAISVLSIFNDTNSYATSTIDSAIYTSTGNPGDTGTLVSYDISDLTGEIQIEYKFLYLAESVFQRAKIKTRIDGVTVEDHLFNYPIYNGSNLQNRDLYRTKRINLNQLGNELVFRFVNGDGQVVIRDIKITGEFIEDDTNEIITPIENDTDEIIIPIENDTAEIIIPIEDNTDEIVIPIEDDMAEPACLDIFILDESISQCKKRNTCEEIDPNIKQFYEIASCQLELDLEKNQCVNIFGSNEEYNSGWYSIFGLSEKEGSFKIKTLEGAFFPSNTKFLQVSYDYKYNYWKDQNQEQIIETYVNDNKINTISFNGFERVQKTNKFEIPVSNINNIEFKYMYKYGNIILNNIKIIACKEESEVKSFGADSAEKRCEAICLEQLFIEGADLSEGPCLSEKDGISWNEENWACDLVHLPLKISDTQAINQCQEYRKENVEHIVEISPNCEIINVD